MSRIDRLELVVRNLADRILGESITFDQIAEQEASEQGVTYTPPVAKTPGTDPDVLAAIEQKLAEIADNYVPADVAPLHAEIAELKERVAAADARHIEQERNIQIVIQAAADLVARLDQHKGVINGVRDEVLGIRSAIAGVSDDAGKKRSEAA